MAGHKFDPEKAKRLDSNLRKLFLPTNKIISDIKPAKNETWVDVGAGTGIFTIPLAARVKKVYAIDISKVMIQTLQEKLNEKNINNVETKKSTETVIPLKENLAENVLLAFVAHELDNPENYFKETSRILKPKGRLIIVDYAKVISIGPPLKHRLDPMKVDKWSINTGFSKGKKWKWTRSVIGWEFIKNQ